MTEQKVEIFESRFHRWYVGGVGPIEESREVKAVAVEVTPEERYEALLSQYRRYVGDPEAELPEEIISEFVVN